MPFANTQQSTRPPVNADGSAQAQKKEFRKLAPGSYTIRILDTEAYDVLTHFVNGVSVECLGDDCPICLTNKSLYMQYPETYREEPRYSARTKRYFVNVLDKTVVRSCPKCGKEYADLSITTCSSCREVIAGQTPAPSNKVKILARGVSLFDQLNSIESAVLNDKKEVIGLTNYDINLVVSGTGKSTIVTPIPVVTSNEPIPDGLTRYNLRDCTIKLTADEILELRRGVSLRDIFAARRATNPVDTTSAVANPEVEAAARARVEELFSK